jgi:hypothetical protein
MKKRVKYAWGVLVADNSQTKKMLSPFGNGHEFQYPVFHTRTEAQNWYRRQLVAEGRIVRVSMEYLV